MSFKPVRQKRGWRQEPRWSDDGATLWFTLQSGNRIGRLDTASGRIVEYPTSGGPYAVTIDGAGMVWANEFSTDTVVRLDPASGAMRVIKLPTPAAGIRKMLVDAQGRLWYMGSHNGRLGMVK